MFEWWSGLNTLTQVFFAAAVCFGVMFLWQFLAAMLGIGGHGDAMGGGHDLAGGHGDLGHGDAGHAGTGTNHAGPNTGHVVPGVAHTDLSTGHADATSGHHAQQIIDRELVAFQILSFRSILAFFTLFTWYVALSLLGNPTGVFWAVIIGLLWGLAGMFTVAIVFYLLRRLSETGTARIETCVGTNGVVYLDIPEGGTGEVRCTVSGAITMVKARGAGGLAIKAGTPVLVLWSINPYTVEVEPLPQI